MHVSSERDHQEHWYRQAIAERFFEREGFRRLIARNLAHLRRSVPVTGEMSVLSLGCGTGEYELALAPEVAHVFAIDLSETAIAEARRRAAAAGLRNVEFRVATIDDLELHDRSLDLVFAMGLLHHLQPSARRTLLARTARALRAAGWFYARDPNARGALRRFGSPCFRDSRFLSPDEAPIDPDQLVADAVAAGFADCRLDYTDVLAGPLPWLLPSSSRLLWAAVSMFDRAWLAVPGLRTFASQFALTARTPAVVDEKESHS